jgi:hypothetical protein
MVSTYTTNLRLNKQAQGDNRNSWGTVFNTGGGSDLIDEAIAGYVSIAMADANVTLTVNNGASDQSRKPMLKFTGANTNTRTVTIPAVSKQYIIYNATSGGFAIFISNGSNIIQIGSAETVLLWTDGSAMFSSTLGNASTDNAVARFNGTDGRLQNSGVIISDSNDISGVGTLSCGAITSSGGGTFTGLAVGVGGLVTSGNIQVSQIFLSSAGTCVLGTASAGTIYFRPNSYVSTTGQATLDNAGTFSSDNIASGSANSTNGAGMFMFSSGRSDSRRTGTGAQGMINFYNNAAGTPNLCGQIVTNGSTCSYISVSDEREKDFDGPYDPLKAIDIIKHDPVREWHWKKDGSYGVGWGAQTSYSVSPELAVPPTEDNDVWGVSKGDRTPYIWAALSNVLERLEAIENARA